MYQHQQLLAENVVDMATLPAPLQNMIAHFAEQEFDLEAEENSEDTGGTASSTTTEEIRSLRTTLKKLDHTLYQEIKAVIDQELTDDLTVEETKMAILSEFIEAGNPKPTVNALKKAGYPFRNTLRIEENVGSYKLIKKRYASNCLIIQR